MADITVTIQGLDKLVANFKKYPEISSKYIDNALKASIFSIQKFTDDGGDSGLFQFKTPRSMRTGYLARSFAFGISYGNLTASIGPTALYAPYVYFGTRRMGANPYMDRIAKAAEPNVNEYFAQANEQIVQEIATL